MCPAGAEREGARRRLTFVTDIVTPYMAAVFGALAERAELTVLFCSASGTRGANWAFAEGLPFRHEIIGGAALRRRSLDATDFYLSPRIVTALARSRPEVIVAAGFSIPTAYAAAYARATGAALVIHSDGTSHSERQLTGYQRVARHVLLRGGRVCVANSEPAARRFGELGVPAGRIFRAPHSTRLEPLWEVARHRRPGPPGRLRVLNVGRLIPRKGLALLVEAVALAARAEPGISLTLVGEGPEEQALRALAAERGVDVTFAGFVDQPGLPEVYAAADAFAFPTLDDPFGLVLLEAAASGLPLVSSPHAGATADLVDDGREGWAIDPADTAGWAVALVALARDPGLRGRMGRAAHAATLERTPAAAAQGYLDAGEAALRASVR